MRSHLIVDIMDRSMFALLVDGNGKTFPCTHNVMEYSLRYFFGETLLDLKTFGQLKGEQKKSLSDIVDGQEYDIITIGKKFGWIWPFQLKRDEIAIPIKHPLKKISSSFLSGSDGLMKRIRLTSLALMAFLLEPIFRYVKSTDYDITELNSVVIIPNYFNRHAKLLLYKMLRQMKFHKIMLVHREVAVVMGCLPISPFNGAVVLDMEVKDTHLHRVEVGKPMDEETIRLECSNCLTIRGYGWKSMIKHFTEILSQRNIINEEPTVYQGHIDSGLMKLIYGIPSSWLSSPPTQEITHGLFNNLVAKQQGKSKVYDVPGLAGWLRKMDSNDHKIIPIGLPFMVGNFENMVLAGLKILPLPVIQQYRSLERAAYGIATGLKWLSGNPGRKIKVLNRAGFRVVTRPGETIELIPYTALPIKPGEKRTFKQVLDFQLVDCVEEDTLHFQLLWGMNANPQYNAKVCLLSLQVSRVDCKEGRKVEVILDLHNTKFGGDIMGTITIQLGEQRQKAEFSIDKGVREIDVSDIS